MFLAYCMYTPDEPFHEWLLDWGSDSPIWSELKMASLTDCTYHFAPFVSNLRPISRLENYKLPTGRYALFSDENTRIVGICCLG